KANNESIQLIERWFADSVEGNFSRFIVFLGQLAERLEKGGKFDVFLTAYCSPLNYNAYNLRLGRRRSASVLNYILLHANKSLEKYIQNGQLKIIQSSEGEEKSAPGVSDSLQDLDNSVYSIEAAQERRVEVRIKARL
ncbi:MAG: hypothetical protein NZ522_04040, partial [Chitinophagales bacterium]|nr:hypothetical protein [Chitinophagales bacterium]